VCVYNLAVLASLEASSAAALAADSLTVESLSSLLVTVLSRFMWAVNS
jgi:hypothetical protein